jgi:acyl-CoA synthetase (AMP-forming)/AMP-acid ligase II
MRQHLLQDIRTHASANPDPGKCAICDTKISIDYASLERFSTRLAVHLLALGCKVGDRVVVLANRRAILVAAILGIFRAGCIHVPLDCPLPAGRLQYIVNIGGYRKARP